MNRIYENLDIAIGLEPQSIASSNVTGPFYDMAEYREALAIMNVGNISAGGTVALQIRQASSSTGADVVDLTSRVATISANVKVKALSVTCADGEAGDTITFTIDGTAYEYTGAAEAESSGGEWSSTGDNDADVVGILACINDPTVGFDSDKAYASAAAAVLTINAKDGYYIDAVAETGAFTTFATTKANAFVWFDSMDLTEGLPFVATKITTDSNTGICDSVLLRGKKKGDIEEKVGAQYPAAV